MAHRFTDLHACRLFVYRFGMIPPVYVQVPWVMPVGIYAFLGTGGNLLAGLVSLLNLGLSFLIWSPFVILANRMKEVD